MKKRVLLGMSGGVDSSVSAVILQKRGYEVIGATMKLWEPSCSFEGESSCCGSEAVYDAKRVCDKLGIPHYTLNYKQDFKCKVVDKFIDDYKNAKTPNPCIECNKYLKFKCFYEKALELECDYIATGHYAKTIFSEKYNQVVLTKSNESKKDQTYFLYTMPKNEIEHVIFPLQDFKCKQEIRKIAEEEGLLVAHKKDSQEICFIPDNDYHSFLKRYLDQDIKSGNIVLKNGEILGKHNGLINYTIGQRKRLGIAYKEPLYVIGLDIQKNEVIVGCEEQLYSKELYANEINWMVNLDFENPVKCLAKIRYRAKEANAIIYKIESDKIKVEFEEPQRAITKGQSVVFYDEEGVVLGGGKIL